MTVPIVGDLLLSRNPLSGRLRDAVHALTLDISTSDVAQVSIALVDKGLEIWKSNQLLQGAEISWEVNGFKRELTIAATSLGNLDGIELVTLECRPAGVEQLRNYRGANTWAGMTPTQWLAGECAKAAKDSHTIVNFVGQPTMTRSQILRRADKGQVPESSWDVAGNLASEEGFWLFENAGTVFFASPSWLALTYAGAERDQWTWPRPANGKTPLMEIPSCRVSDYAQKANLQPATVDAKVPMEYALTLAPGETIRVEIPGYRGRYLVTKVTITAGEALASVSLESPVDPAPHTDLVTLSNPTTGGSSDASSVALTDVAIGAYWYNAMIQQGYTDEQAVGSLPRAIGTALAESRGIPTAHNPVPPDDSWGLWQINVLGGIRGNVRDGFEALTHTGLTWPDDLARPEVNAYGAVLLSAGGTNWGPWKGDKYPDFLARALYAAPFVTALPRNGKLLQIPAIQVRDQSPLSDVERFVQFCLSKVGDDYVWGAAGALDANGKPAYDCSGLVYAALTSMGIKGVPHGARAIFTWCRNNHLDCSVPQAKNTRGTLLFRLNSSPDHVVVSLGNGDLDVEAKGAKYGVVQDHEGNRFDHAALIPGLDYGSG